MRIRKKEPEQLRRGKRFHNKIQKDWELHAEGTRKIEKSVTKPSGRKGRVDVFVQSENPLVATIFSAKSSASSKKYIIGDGFRFQ